MQVSTKIFNKQSVETFSDLTRQIQKKQEQVAAGKELTKPSDDPVRSTRVMVVKEQQAQNAQYLRNIDISYVKLGLTESALEQASNLATRAYELAVQARSDTNAGSRSVIAIELKGIRESLRELANSSDASGRSIFGGFKIGTPPFTVDNSGNTSFTGDRGCIRFELLHLWNYKQPLMAPLLLNVHLRQAVDMCLFFLLWTRWYQN